MQFCNVFWACERLLQEILYKLRAQILALILVYTPPYRDKFYAPLEASIWQAYCAILLQAYLTFILAPYLGLVAIMLAADFRCDL